MSSLEIISQDGKSNQNGGEVVNIIPKIGQEVIDWIEENLESKIFDHITNENTESSYINNGKKFLSYIKETGFSSSVMERYVKFLNKTEKNQNTKAARGRAAIAIVKRVSFFRSDLIPPAINMKLTAYAKFEKSTRKHQREGLHPDEVGKIESYLFNLPESPEKRVLMAQYVLFRFQGLRASELIRITRKDFDYANKKIKVLRKGNGSKTKHRLFTRTILEIKIYCKYFDTKEELFKGLTRQKLRTIWKSIFDELGIKDRTIHDWRHFLGSWVARVTKGNAYAVQDVLGHKTITTSQYYVDDWMKEQMFDELDKLIENGIKTV